MVDSTTKMTEHDQIIADWRASKEAGENNTRKTVRLLRQRRTRGRCEQGNNPNVFTHAAIPIDKVHFLSLVEFDRMPDGKGGVEPGLKVMLSDIKGPTEAYPDSLLAHGCHPDQVYSKILSRSLTPNGRGVTISPDDELLPVWHLMLRALREQQGTKELVLPLVLGTEPSIDIVAALRMAAMSPSDWNMFQATCSGKVVAVVTETNGYIQLAPDREILDVALVAEENIDCVDTIAILPGTAPVVQVGDQVELGQPVLQVDAEAISQLSREDLDNLASIVNFMPETPEVLAPRITVAKQHLYSGHNGCLPRGKLYFDLREPGLTDGEGEPLIQVGVYGTGIVESDHIREDYRQASVKWERKKDFEAPSPRHEARTRARNRRKLLKDLGARGALMHLTNESLAMPTEEYDLKLDNLSSGPIPLSAEMSKEIGLFQLSIRHGENSRLSVTEKTETINEFLRALLDIVQSSTEEVA